MFRGRVRSGSVTTHWGVVLTSAVMNQARQHFGVLGIRQLRDEFGISAHAISRARASGLVIDVARGVVRLASSPDTFEARCMAMQFVAQGAGCISGWSAGHLHGLRAMPTSRIHYTVDVSFRRSVPAWVHLHRCSWYEPDRDRVELGQLIVATPLRMLFGLAAAYNQHRFERAAEDAWHRRLLSPADAADYLERHRCRGKDGVSTMERWLEHALPRPLPTQSNLERRLLEALADVGLPDAERQLPVALGNGEVIHLDIAWPNAKLAVEPGASWWHGGDLGQRRDQTRDRACAEVGWLVLRFDESMRKDVGAAARQVKRIHQQRSIDLRNLHGS